MMRAARLGVTVDGIAYHALARPEAIAVIHDGRRVTCADFYRDIRRSSAAFGGSVSRPRGSAGIQGRLRARQLLFSQKSTRCA
jgi:hypothetical protein